MAYYVIEDNKCLVDFDDVTNSRIVTGIAAGSTLATLFTQFSQGITMYRVLVGTTTVYPVTTGSNRADIICYKFGDSGYFIFSYNGDCYICPVITNTPGSWVKFATPTDIDTAVDTAKTAMQIPVNGMFMSSTSISTAEQVRAMLGYGTWNYYGQLLNTPSQIAVNVFIRLT